jgi:hypothetical protein
VDGEDEQMITAALGKDTGTLEAASDAAAAAAFAFASIFMKSANVKRRQRL